MMTPDELRALADALQPMAAAPCFDGIDIERAAAHLRAQADAQPVAYRQWNSDEGYWYYGDASCAEKDDELPYTHPAPTAPHHAMLDSHRRLVEQAIQSAEHPSGMSTHDGKARIDASILRRMLAIIDSLSAVPAGWKLVPVEPTPEMLSAVGMMDGYDWHAPGCSPDADHANWYSAMIAAAPAAPQAEPKREPLPGLAPTHRCPACGALWRQCDDASWNLRSALCCGLCDAGRVELVRLLDEPKREPLSDEQVLILLRSLAPDVTANLRGYTAIVRAVERHHGIGDSDAE